MKYEERLLAAAERAETVNTHAVLLVEKKCALQLRNAESRSAQATARLELLEDTAKHTPDRPVKVLWKKITS